MKLVENEKFTNNYTNVYCEPENYWDYNAPHNFMVASVPTQNMEAVELTRVNFQKGPIKECGVNGVANEDLLLMVITRLEAFQKSEYACSENAEALDNLYAAVDALRSRTNRRIKAGTEGTSALD